MNNQELMQKADWSVGDLETTGGKLNDEQANQFIRKLLVQPTILNQARTVTMSSPQRQINKIQFASRILKPAVSNTPLSSGDRSAPTTEQVLLTTKEVIAEVRLPYDVIEDNIERGNIGAMTDTNGTPTSGGIRDTIMTLIAERAALDLEELALLGDTGSGDSYLALLDGWLIQSTTNVVDLAGASISKDTWKQGLQAMPDQYLRNRAAMRHFVSVDNEIAYRDSLANRETALGDAQIQGTSPVFGFGVPVDAASLMPAVNGLSTNPLNMIFGIQRDIHIETDKDITSRVYIIVLTMRMDFKYEEEEAVVKYINMG
jgi:hypothetical protein